MAASQESNRKMRLGKCPFQFVAPENNANVCKDFLGYRELDGIVRSKPEGWIFCGRYEKDGHADKIYNFDIRDNDVWILSYPKSGRTAVHVQILVEIHTVVPRAQGLRWEACATSKSSFLEHREVIWRLNNFSGTTWTQHMLWLLLNPDDRNTRVRVDLRSPFIEWVLFDLFAPPWTKLRTFTFTPGSTASLQPRR